MSIKLSIGSKIYDISAFSEDHAQDLIELSKSLNFRVNQVISAFGVYDQEMALIMAALSLLEELKVMQEVENEKFKKGEEVDLFNYDVAKGTEEGHAEKEEKIYTKKDMEEAILNTIENLTNKLKNVI